jgi:hypothetical protein
MFLSTHRQSSAWQSKRLAASAPKFRTRAFPDTGVRISGVPGLPGSELLPNPSRKTRLTTLYSRLLEKQNRQRNVLAYFVAKKATTLAFLTNLTCLSEVAMTFRNPFHPCLLERIY